MKEPGKWRDEYHYQLFQTFSDIASDAWERLPFNATPLYEYPLSRDRPDLHAVHGKDGTHGTDCLHFHKTMTQCAAGTNDHGQRALDGAGPPESEQQEMASWWIVLLYNLIDARVSRGPG